MDEAYLDQIDSGASTDTPGWTIVTSGTLPPNP